jgi:hypothetical protein
MDASTLVGYDDTGYAVVSHGDSGSYFCDETTLAHELGHNMGSMHDHRTDPFSTSGVFSYSFGHGVDNAFSTIMAYPSSFTNGPTIGKFSNPLIDCVGRPCGVSGSANNALSMNNVRAQVANYRPTTVTGTYALSVSKTGRGSGTVASADSAINCGSACAASYSANTVVSLTATPAQNSIFAGWADACSGVGACNVSMGSSQRVVANFSLGEVVLDVPGAPGIGAAVAGDMSASIAFTAPANDGGATIDLYRATCSGGIYATGTVSPIIVAGLSNGGTYFCTVAAHNSQGWGPESGISNMVTPKSTVNQTVVALNLTNLSGSSGNSQFYSFVVPTGASNLLVQTIGVGSGDVDLYVRYGSQPTASEYDCGSENYSNNELCLIDSPTLGTYFVELFAYESFSGVNLLISYNSNVTASVPDAPVNVAAIAGVESASVLFSAPFSNGGATIDNYRASCGGGIGTSTISPIVVTGLTNGVSYTCTVSAHNSVGWGPESAASNSFTPQASTPTPIPFNLITHYYTNILNRVADDGGKAFWQSEVNRMSNLSVSPNEAYIALALNFFTSAEFLARGFGDEQFVRNLYLTFYNREADQGGLDYWRGLLSSGLPRDMIMYAFMFSPEFGNFMIQNIGATYQRPEVGAVIDYYRGAFGRLPDDGGLKYWVNQFRVAQCSGNPTAGVYTAATSIASAFFGSAEYNNAAPSANKYISDLFNAFMRRSADLEGYNFWVSQVATGAQSKDAVRQQFVDSPEFAARVQAIVGAACTGMMQ